MFECIKKLSLISLISSASLSCIADEQQIYIGTEYASTTFEADSFRADLGTISLVIGAKINDYINVEAKAGIGIEDETFGQDKIAIDQVLGVYGKFFAAYSTPLKAYVIIGYSQIETSTSGAFSLSANDTESDFSYGLGLDYDLSQQFSIGLEYMQIIDENFGAADAVNLGLRFSF